jgi:hypothetical protein
MPAIFVSDHFGRLLVYLMTHCQLHRLHSIDLQEDYEWTIGKAVEKMGHGMTFSGTVSASSLMNRKRTRKPSVEILRIDTRNENLTITNQQC